MCFVRTFRYLCDHECHKSPAFDICNDIQVSDYTTHDLSRCRNFKTEQEILQQKCPQCELELEKLRRKKERKAQKQAARAAEEAKQSASLARKRQKWAHLGFLAPGAAD